MRSTLLSLLVLFLVFPTVGLARTIVVRPDGSGDYPTIQQAVAGAVNGDIVALSMGTFVGEGNRDVTLGGKSITIRSLSGDPAGCVIDCQHAGRAFLLQAQVQGTIFQGITMTRGQADWGGGAVGDESLDGPAYIDCVFSHNVSSEAGGAILGGYSSSFLRCRFLDNTAEDGAGGAFCAGVMGGQLLQTFDECEFIGNSATEGGAVYLERIYLKSSPSEVAFRNCVFAGNEATNGGGAVSLLEHSPTFDHCTFAGNAAGSLGIIKCAAVLGLCNPVLSNCMVVLSISGVGVTCGWNCHPVLNCSDVFGNPGGDWTGSIADQAGQRGNIAADPLFCDLTGGNYRLQEASPCAPAPNPECGLIGALPVECSGPVPVRQLSWGRIKALYK